MMGLVLRQSLMVISSTGVFLYAKVSPLYKVLWAGFVIVYKHFDWSLHIGSLDPSFMQNFTPVPLTVFEILGLKLKNKNNDKRTKVQDPRRSFVEHRA